MSKPPLNPASVDKPSAPQGENASYGHWVLLSVVLLCTLAGFLWVRRGAGVERPRIFSEEILPKVASRPTVKTGFRVESSSSEGVRVVLSKKGARYPAGAVPVGDYTIQVSFDGGGVRYGGKTTVQDGIVSVIQCDKVSLSCTVTP